MQIILLEKVINLGQLGDVVRVKDGYARNFLIPGGKARRATANAIKEFEVRRSELEKVQADKLAAARAEGEKLSGMTVQLTEKAGVDGRLFGSVTNLNVVAALHKQGFTSIDKTMVKFPEGPLKTIGDHKIHVSLHTDVVVDITVSVLGEAA
jgi:large subunit ribosomal protein L9